MTEGIKQSLKTEIVRNAQTPVAILTLQTLRYLRDNSPEEWSALVQEQEDVVTALWDFLQKYEQIVS